MKKLLAFALMGVMFCPSTAFAAESPNPTPLLMSSFAINHDGNITVSWKQILDVQEYEICIDQECQTYPNYRNQVTISPKPLEPNKTRTIIFRALLRNDATNYNYTGINNTKWADTRWVTYEQLQLPTTVSPTTVSALSKEEEIESCPTLTWDVNGKCLVSKTVIPPKSVEPESKVAVPKSSDTGPDVVIGDPPVKVIPPVKAIPLVIPKTIKNQKEITMFGLKENEFFVVSVLFILAFIYIIIAQMKRSKMAIMRFELECKETEFNFESKRYELRELAKSKIDKDHEVALKTIDKDHEVALKTIDSSSVTNQLQFTEKQLENERNHNLEQQRINTSSADKMLSFIMPIIEGRDQHELRMAEITASSGIGMGLQTENIKKATVKYGK